MGDVVPVTALSLAGIRALAGLEMAERTSLATHCNGNRFAPGERILYREDEANSVLFVISGRVGITLVSANGRETSLRDLNEGDMFGELGAIDGRPRSADVVAKTETIIASVSANAFRAMLREYPGFLDFTLRHVVGLVRSLSDRVFEYDTYKVSMRVRLELYRQAAGAGEIVPAPKASDIASRVSTHREAVSREMSRLTKQGIIKRGEGRLLILDAGALVSEAQGGNEGDETSDTVSHDNQAQ